MSHVSFYRDDERSRLKKDYEKRIEQEQARIGELKLNGAAIVAEESQWARRHLLLAEKNHVLDSFRQGILEQEIYDKLLADIDTRLLRLESGEDEKTAAEPGSDQNKE